MLGFCKMALFQKSIKAQVEENEKWEIRTGSTDRLNIVSVKARKVRRKAIL